MAQKKDSATPGPETSENDAFHFELEDPETGQVFKAKFQFATGVTKCRLRNGEVVSVNALIKLANGKELAQSEAAENPGLLSLGKAGAEAWLHHLVNIQATFLVRV
jgi:hypothetical protein